MGTYRGNFILSKSFASNHIHGHSPSSMPCIILPQRCKPCPSLVWKIRHAPNIVTGNDHKCLDEIPEARQRVRTVVAVYLAMLATSTNMVALSMVVDGEIWLIRRGEPSPMTVRDHQLKRLCCLCMA